MSKLKKTKLSRQNAIIGTKEKIEPREYPKNVKFQRQNTFIIRDEIADLLDPNSIMYNNKKIRLQNIERILQDDKYDLNRIKRSKLFNEKERLKSEILKESVDFHRKYKPKKYVSVASALLFI